MINTKALLPILPLLLVGVFCDSNESISEFDQNVLASIEKFNVQFSATVLKEIKPEENLLVSGINIYSALALLHLGASGESRDELSKALGFPSNDKLLETHQAFAKILQTIQKTESAEVSFANGVFVQTGNSLKSSYTNASKQYYDNEVQLLNFGKGGDEATSAVNQWISDKTKSRIPKLFKDAISPATELLLASALYFHAKWHFPFYGFSTRSEQFDTGVKKVNVPTMSDTKYVPYVDDQTHKFQAISLPYQKEKFAALILLPYSNQTVQTLVDTLKSEDHQKLRQELGSPSTKTSVNYKIPRFKFNWSQTINRYINDIGIKKIFGNAELGNMVEDATNLAVSDITHAAEIEVNEEGTTASAVTTIQVTRTSLLQLEKPIEFFVDRPFIFIIYHRDTGSTLFTGIVQNPNSN